MEECRTEVIEDNNDFKIHGGLLEPDTLVKKSQGQTAIARRC